MISVHRRELLACILFFSHVAAEDKKINCGGHLAASCEDCPEGNGADWCNGECKWIGRCVHQDHEEDKLEFLIPPDTRHSRCPKEVKGNFSGHTVSIIIPWHQEKWMHLRHTLQAILHFTPNELIEEFIFVSDGNTDSKEKELKAISDKVKVLAFDERQGLIRAKSAAVKMAKAPVLMFLEGHCIVNRFWLEALLERLILYPKAIVMPVLDSIPQNNWFQYLAGTSAYHWRFEWNMNLVHTNPTGRHENQVEPYISPGTSGGIFVMRRDWFNDLEFFDEGMLEWGGDHVELSFKTWRCGGRIEIVPCSRIGHLFREPSFRPYPVSVDQVVKNYDRLARLWWKDHLEYFYRMKPEAKTMTHSDLEQAEESYARVQETHQCKDHQWYLDNVDHEMAWEIDHLCHPHLPKDHSDSCQGGLATGRWTVTQTIPKEDYLRRLKEAGERDPALSRAHEEL